MANCEKCNAELVEGVEHTCTVVATEAPAEEAAAEVEAPAPTTEETPAQ